MPQIKIDFGDGKPLETAPGGNLKIPVKVVRGEKTKGRLKFRLAGACRGMNAQDSRFRRSQRGHVQLNINGQLPAGKYTLPLRAYATVNCRHNPEAADAATARSNRLEKIAADLATAARQAEKPRRRPSRRPPTPKPRFARRSKAWPRRIARCMNPSRARKRPPMRWRRLKNRSADAAAKLQAAEAAQAKADKAVADTKGRTRIPRR